MTRKYLMTLLALIALVSCHPTKQNYERSISKNLDSLFNNARDFSGVVLIAENGIPIYHKAFGYKNFATKIPLDKSKVAGNEENTEYLKKYHPKEYFKPGEKYDYSNTGYMLLASIAEKVSGKDFIQLCRERIFKRVKMFQTDVRSNGDKVKLRNIAWGHIYVPEKQAYIHADSFPAFNYSIWLGKRKGPGRVSSTTSDLLKWDHVLYAETLVKHETLNEAFTPARLNNGTLSHYGFGWSLSEHPRLGRKIYHGGDNPGFKTIIMRYTDVNKTIILLCNNGHEKFDDLVKQIENEISR